MSALTDWPAAPAGLLVAALHQMVLAVGWLTVASLFREIRSPSLHWAGFALLSSASFVAYVSAADVQSDAMRTLGNLLLVAGVLLEGRGVHLFTGRRPPDGILAGTLAASALVLHVWPSTQDSPVRIAALSTIVAALAIWIAQMIVAHIRSRTTRRRLALLAGLPLLLTAFALLYRAVKVVTNPDQTIAASVAGNWLHISSVIFWVLLSQALQLTLVGLVIFELGSRLRHAARHDPLTGLLNRRALEEALEHEIRRAARTAKPFAVAMLDIDHFKAINDRHGHAAGDHVLREIASRLLTRLRSTDTLGRWGGEEFLALLPDTGPLDALAVGDAMREIVRDAGIGWKGDAIALTVSVGVAGWCAPGDDAGSLVDRADAALYRAKRAGRDRTYAGVEAAA